MNIPVADTSQSNEDDLQNLVSMGFDYEKALLAVSSTNSIEEALNYLLNENETTCHTESERNPNNLDSSLDFSSMAAIAKSVLTHERSLQLQSDNEIISWVNTVTELHRSIQNLGTDYAFNHESIEEHMFQLQTTYRSIAPSIECLLDGRAENINHTFDSNLNLNHKHDDIIENGDSESSDNLMYALDRRESLSKEIEKQRTIVKSFMKYPHSINEDTLEELYLFLKEMIHANVDLNQRKEEIHEFVFSRINSSHSSLIPCLIELLVLENEDFQLVRLIRTTVDQSTGSSKNNIENEDKLDTQENKESVIVSPRLCHILDENKSELECMENILNNANHSDVTHLSSDRSIINQDGPVQSTPTNDVSKHDKILQDRNVSEKESINFRNRAIMSGMKKKHDIIVEEIMNGNMKRDEINKKISLNLINSHFQNMKHLQSTLENERERQLNSLKCRLKKKHENRNDTMYEEKEDINREFQLQNQIVMEEPIRWIVGNLLGVNISIQNEDSISKETLSNAINTFYSLYVQQIMKFQRDLLEEKLVQETNLQKDLNQSRIHQCNTVNDDSSDDSFTDKNILNYFNDKFDHLQEVMLSLIFQRWQRQIETLCKDSTQSLCPSYELETKYSHLLKFLHDNYKTTLENSVRDNQNKSTFLIESSDLREKAEVRVSKVFEYVLEMSCTQNTANDEAFKKPTNEISTKRLKAENTLDYQLKSTEGKLTETHDEKGKENQRGDPNIYSLIDNVYTDFASERGTLHQQISEERHRQITELRKRRMVRNMKKGVVGKCSPSSKIVIFKDDVKKITEQHALERETLEITLDLERARQKRALQLRLISMREKRKNPKEKDIK